MQTIAINTTQNVTIEYELAAVRDRIIAFIFDIVIIIISIFLLAFLYNVSFRNSSGFEYFIFLVLIPLFFFYSLFSEMFNNGQSLGKKALGIKVVKLNGKEPTKWDYLMRWAFRWVDIYASIGTIAAMLISSSAKGQRLGDIIANTAVIKTKPTRKISLSEVLSIKTLENYTPEYPRVMRCTEDDMLIIKNTLEECRRYPNEAHQLVLEELAQKAAEKIGEEKFPSESEVFLKTLLKDYVILSR